jgi:hypothetical protein
MQTNDTAYRAYLKASPGRWGHLDATYYISVRIIHTKYNRGRLNDSTAHGYLKAGYEYLGIIRNPVGVDVPAAFRGEVTVGINPIVTLEK